MAKVGRFVVDPKAGAYCTITLDSGHRVMLNHDKGGFKGGKLTIVELKWMGFGSGDTLLDCDLDSPDARAVLARLTAGAPAGSVDATALGAFVRFVKECASIPDLKARCAALFAGAPPAPGAA